MLWLSVVVALLYTIFENNGDKRFDFLTEDTFRMTKGTNTLFCSGSSGNENTIFAIVPKVVTTD
jgi:hypothetical protein